MLSASGSSLRNLKAMRIVALECPCGHLRLEHDIQVVERPTLGLWKFKVHDDDRHKTESEIDPTNLATHIAFVLIEHVWNDDIPHG